MTEGRRSPVAQHMNEFNKPKTHRDRHKEHKLGEEKWKHNKADPYKRQPISKQEVMDAWNEVEEQE